MKLLLYICFRYLIFLVLENRSKAKIRTIVWTFLVLLFSVRIVESVKESQGGFESALGLLSTGQWLSIPFIDWSLFFFFHSRKPVKI
jgi:prolipoprotein diacylglyceryltransferase